MSSLVIYSCHCLNIRIHLATKYTLDNIETYKKDNAVNEPLVGWEFELGMGGLNTEFSFLTSSQHIKPEWNTVKCFNCNTDNIYSIPNSNIPNQHASNKIIIHENAICGKDIDQLKQKSDYSSTFSVNLSKDNMEESIPMPDSTEDIPDNLISTHKQIKSTLDQSIEQFRLESKVRIEQFKKQEEKKLQDQISHAKLENTLLWTRLVNTSKLVNDSQKDEQEQNQHHHHSNNHVRFAEEDRKKQATPTSSKRLSFALDESSINHLKNVHLDSRQNTKEHDTEDDQDYDEEDMFNLDEELSEEENDDDLNDKIESSVNDMNNQNNDLLLSSSLKKSISEIDQRFSWAKKKKNTNKYMSKDFDIKTELTKDTTDTKPISLFATSVPISIHYPLADDEPTTTGSVSPNKQDILASSFANYDSSFSDRQLSSQFPAPRRRKSLASSSLIRPQLDSLTSKSLDTRGLVRKKTNEIDLHESDEEFDSTVPPHVWAATMEEE